MQRELPPLVYEIKDRILQCVEAEEIILFGSYAYGIPRPDSDFDFYVVLPDDYPDLPVTASQKIYKELYSAYFAPSVDVISQWKSHYEDRCTLPTMERKIANEGIVIYERS